MRSQSQSLQSQYTDKNPCIYNWNNFHKETSLFPCKIHCAIVLHFLMLSQPTKSISQPSNGSKPSFENNWPLDTENYANVSSVIQQLV